MINDTDDKKIEDHFLTKEEFSKWLERVVIGSEGDITYLEAAVYTAEFFEIEPEQIPKFITQKIKDRIESQAIKDHMIHKSRKNREESLSAYF